jgi:hypothetical protein
MGNRKEEKWLRSQPAAVSVSQLAIFASPKRIEFKPWLTKADRFPLARFALENGDRKIK